MSATILRNIALALKFSFIKEQTIKYAFNPYTAFVGLIGSSGHMIYTYGTSDKKLITPSDVYQYDTFGETRFMIVDQNGKHYRFNNSLWYWKWDTIEDAIENRKKNEDVEISYYGWRIPILGMFPNVYASKSTK
jgi:hypothetical protein